MEWISVNDRLPKSPIDKRGYLCIYKIDGWEFYLVANYYLLDENPHFQHESAGVKVTHWMPLPEPPKESD